MSTDNELFNRYHSPARIRIEHTIGILKGRFSSLQSLRIKIHDKKSHRVAVNWMKACVDLRIMLLTDSYYDDNWTKYRDPEATDVPQDAALLNGKGFRENIKQRVLSIKKSSRRFIQ
ncbi:hypothetical protein RvY_08981 [Ramazzottius varieornatus]|uniref:DDE Tnp4 domain-containing protein n=1 Tax=Ramazzottius varieornatus TaxID=947166 RepID=A0A1D1VAA4_RAMVA|nr:hypothetical protein RvY_08981 [Ramazzottius varieornatus]